MQITVFTSNQPRHIALIDLLSQTADRVFAIQESGSVASAVAPSGNSILKKYFERVQSAEREVFGDVKFLPQNVHQLALGKGDLNRIALSVLGEALSADIFVVFGSSFIKGELCDLLVRKRAINLHMGLSPYYRGSATNFWALYDGRPEMVGGTLHLLNQGLDSGPMLCHALPAAEDTDPFLLGMKAVKSSHLALRSLLLENGTIGRLVEEPQDKSLQLRYARTSDFTETVAREYLERELSPEQIGWHLRRRDLSQFLRPYVA